MSWTKKKKGITENERLIQLWGICQIDEDRNYSKLKSWKSEENKRIIMMFPAQHLCQAVIQQEEALRGEDNNIESPCCIVSLWQPRGRNQQQLRPYCRAAPDCASTMCAFLCKIIMYELGVCVCSGDDDKSQQGQVTETKWGNPDDYAAVCM